MEGLNSAVDEVMPAVARNCVTAQDPRFDVLRAEVNRSLEIMMGSAREDRIETLKLIAGIRDDMREIRKEIRGLRTRRARRPKKP